MIGLPFSLALASALVLAERGRAPDCSIVVETPSETAETAAGELAGYIEKAVGVHLPVHGTQKCGKTIVLSETSGSGLGEDGFRLSVKGDALHISGGKRGVLYGAHEFLRRFVGVEWFSSWCEEVPGLDSIEVPLELNVEERPAFPVRELFWADVLEDARFAARMRINNRTRRKPEPAWGGNACKFDSVLSNAHTFRKLVPESLFDAHPEYFSEVAGSRVAEGAQLCLSNPDVLGIVTEKVLDRMKANPSARCFGVSQNDWFNWCGCRLCRAVDEAEGSPSGSIVAFVNGVAAAVRAQHPDKYIETLAYQYSRKPPKNLKAADNVVVCLCTIECEFLDSLVRSAYGQNVSFVDDMKGWRNCARNLFVWDYTANFREYLIPFLNLHSIQPNLKFFRDCGVAYMFAQGDNLGHHAEFAELKTFLLAKWMWNPDVPAETLVSRFVRGYYGAAGPVVKDYLAELYSVAADAHGHPMLIDTLPSAIDAMYPAGFFAEWSARFDIAEKLVADDPVRLYNVRTTRLPLDYMVVVNSGKSVFMSEHDRDEALAGDTVRTARRVRDTLALAKSMGRQVKFSERPLVEKDRRRLLDVLLSDNGAIIGTNGVVMLQEDAFVRSGPPGVTSSVADPLASDGRSIRLSNNNCGWYSNFDINQLALHRNRKYSVSIRLRADATGRDGEICSAGIYDIGRRRSVCTLSLAAKDMKDGYAEYELPAFEPRENLSLYVAAGLFDMKKTATSPAHNGVYVDAFAIREK